MAWRACARSAALPWKYCESVKTDRHAAPPRSYAAAIEAGSKLGCRSPLLGDAFLISAMRAGCRPSSASAKERRRGREAWADFFQVPGARPQAFHFGVFGLDDLAENARNSAQNHWRVRLKSYFIILRHPGRLLLARMPPGAGQLFRREFNRIYVEISRKS